MRILLLFLVQTLVNSLQQLSTLSITSHDLTLTFDAVAGNLLHANASNGWSANLSGSSTSIGKMQTLSVRVTRCNQDADICVEREVTSITETSNASSFTTRNITLVDRYHPIVDTTSLSLSVICWTSSVVSSSTSYWRSEWVRKLNFQKQRKWWLSSSGPVNSTTPRFDSLLSRSPNAPTSNCTYGGTSWWSNLLLDTTVEACPIPVSIHGQDSLGGLGHVLAINDTLLSAHATFINATSIKWTRFYDRMGGGMERTWKSYLIFSAQSTDTWRPIMAWTRNTFGAYFNTVTPVKEKEYSQLGGMGAYSCANVNDGLIATAPVSPTLLWDAHFWWPYQGMFFPPTLKGEQWISNIGGGEQNDCGSLSTSFRHGQVVSDDLIRKEYLAAKKRNVTMLSYFNFNFFGENIVVPSNVGIDLHVPVVPVSISETEYNNNNNNNNNQWKNSSKFLSSHFPHSFVPGPIYDWQQSVEMDSTNLIWTSWLVSQAKATRIRIGPDAFRGFVVDEPHLAEFSMNTDDNLSWCGRPCSAALFGWINVSKKVRQTFEEPSQSVLFSNQINTFRVDSLLHFDGIFTETNSDSRFTHAAAVASVGLLTSGRMPGIVWTNPNDNITADVFHQQHLLYGVQPMAPYLGNDHAVQPGKKVYAAYQKYQAVYEWLKGSRWWLNGAVVVEDSGRSSDASSFVSNMFEGGAVGKRTFVLMVRYETSHDNVQQQQQQQLITVKVVGFPTWIDTSTCLAYNLSSGSKVSFVPTTLGVFPDVGVAADDMLCVHCMEKNKSTLNRDNDVVVNVTNKVVNSIDRSFLSFTFDTAFFCQASISDSFLNNKDVQNRASLLMPFSLRVGGTQSDYSLASFGPFVPELPGSRASNWGCNYTMSQFQHLMSFASSLDDDVNMHVVFGLNSLTREGGNVQGKWNGINAKALVSLPCLHNMSWELGNEPVLWSLQPFARNISAAEHARDFDVLRHMVSSSHQVVGPDFFVQCLPQYSDCNMEYLDSFLREKPALDVVTFHLYPWLGTVNEPMTPTASSMMNATLLNQAGIAARAVVSAVAKAGMTSVPVWMGEGSPDWKSERSALGHNFTFEFAWLDMLGQFAESGVQRVYRQSLNSAIGGEITLRMPPAYFMSLLWKILVTKYGSNVDVYRVQISDNTFIRGYSQGNIVILLNTNQQSMMRVQIESNKCHTIRKEWHCVGGPDVVKGKVHGLLVNGAQPRWDKNRNTVDFAAIEKECNAAVDVEAGGVVFVDLST